jgi:hypothetical protein
MKSGILQPCRHTPNSAPARREPADGMESAIRLSVGFDPAWYHRSCGVDLSRRWHTDACYRHETLAVMKRKLCRAFPEIGYWDPDCYEDTRAVSGAHGAPVVPALFGCTLGCVPDRWPLIAARPERPLRAYPKT